MSRREKQEEQQVRAPSINPNRLRSLVFSKFPCLASLAGKLPITPFFRHPPPNLDCQLARNDGPLGWRHKELPVVMTVLFKQ